MVEDDCLDWLLNYLVDAGEQTYRNCKAEGVGGVDIDDELVFGRLLYRQFGRLSAFQNAVHIIRGAAILLRNVSTIAHEAPIIDKGAVRIHCRDAISRRSADYGLAMGDGERIRDHDQPPVALPRK